MMKFVIIVVSVCLVSVCQSVNTDSVLDVLTDAWLQHARTMMISTKNQESTVGGMQFEAACGAFLTRENCTVTADLGVVDDLSSLQRQSVVSMTDFNNGSAQVQLDLAFKVLGIHYPNMIIKGKGVNMEYKGIDVRASAPIPIRMTMLLDYSAGVQKCTNEFQLDLTSSSIPDIVATIQQPKMNLPLKGTMTQEIVNSLTAAAKDHIKAFILYEQACIKLANLF